MNITDVFSAKKIALVRKEVASNRQAYLGEGLFPTKKKMGLDLSWIKTSKGLPVSLKASAFDTVSTIRSREGIKIEETEMAYFKESMLVKEKDEQDILRVIDSNDPYAKDVVAHIFDDANTLLDGADVVPERMIWQLLAPQTDGKPQISFSSDGATYVYDYDPNGEWVENHYEALASTSKWDDADDCDPVKDVSDMCDVIETETGIRPKRMFINSVTMSKLKASDKMRAYVLAQNSTASVVMTDARVKEVFSAELDLTVIVYSKQYKDGATAYKFLPDGFVVLAPDFTLGNTWKGTTPEERTLLARPESDVAITDNGVAITVVVSTDPVQTKTVASEIVLPSYEGMDYVGVIKAF